MNLPLNSDAQFKSSQPVYIVLHIHKCAGVTLSSHILKYFNAAQYYGLYSVNDPLLENRTAIKTYLESRTHKQLGSVNVIMGHGAFYGIHRLIPRPCRYVTFLREPVARTISNYAYFLQDNLTSKRFRKSILDNHGNILDFHTWIQHRVDMHDYMTRFLYQKLFYRIITGEVTKTHLNRVIQKLQTFYLVGIVERPMDHWFFYHSLGLSTYAQSRNQTDQRYYPQNIDREFVKKYMTYDTMLYTYFLTHHQPQISLQTQISLSLNFFKSYLHIVQ